VVPSRVVVVIVVPDVKAGGAAVDFPDVGADGLEGVDLATMGAGLTPVDDKRGTMKLGCKVVEVGEAVGTGGDGLMEAIEGGDEVFTKFVLPGPGALLVANAVANAASCKQLSHLFGGGGLEAIGGQELLKGGPMVEDLFVGVVDLGE
jgi:hypothetical protein